MRTRQQHGRAFSQPSKQQLLVQHLAVDGLSAAQNVCGLETHGPDERGQLRSHQHVEKQVRGVELFRLERQLFRIDHDTKQLGLERSFRSESYASHNSCSRDNYNVKSYGRYQDGSPHSGLKQLLEPELDSFDCETSPSRHAPKGKNYFFFLFLIT
jgi:hypothetical protein